MINPRLYIFIGYPGAGKTTVARFISQKTGAVHLWADQIRHELFPNPKHSMEESHKLYDKLNRQAEDLLASGQSVIFDTNFNHKADRDLMRTIASRTRAELVIIWVVTPYAVAKERAVQSGVTRNGYDYVMSSGQFDAIALKLEEPAEDEKVIKIDGTELDTATLTRLLDL